LREVTRIYRYGQSVARCLIVGCGCRGQALAALIRASGHVVRATTRDPRRLAAITDAGAEAVLADPDRLATLLPALDQVSVVVLPLGSAVGTPELVSALHGPRLVALLEKLIDTPVRGVVYEASGMVDESVLAIGAEQVASACARSRIAYELVFAEPAELTLATAAAVARVLGVRSD
jgi:threonine dehydrogenase-like Zn-dependent dehydrogenase